MNIVENVSKEDFINAYGLKPNLFYDIEGVLVEKEGKNIKVESQVGGKVINYTLRLKEEVDEEVGDKVLIEKENILSSRFSTEDEEDENELRNIKDFLENKGIELTEENLKKGEILLEHNIPLTKESIESLSICEKYLNEIVEKLDYDSVIKLLEKDIDLEEESLQKIAEYMNELETEEDFSLSRFLGFKRDLTYEEAEKISVKIYGRKMGKDIYDSIIALHREGIEITKDNIEKIREIVYKLHDLKTLEDSTLIKVMKKDLSPSIENIYNTKYSYEIQKTEENIAVNIFDDFMVESKASEKDILKLLKSLALEPSEENIALVEKFIVNNLEITVDNMEEMKDMKDALKELNKLLDEKNTSMLLNQNIDPLEEDIREISKILKKDKVDEDFHTTAIDKDNLEKVIEEIENLGKIKDEDLIQLIKKGEDFKIENLKEISLSTNMSEEKSNKAVDKVLKVANIIHSLEEVSSDTISFTVKKFSNISLNNLYESEINLKENNIKVMPVEKSTEDLIREEYYKARRSLSLSIVKQSVEEGLDIEYMPLNELNDYMEKMNKYRQGEKILNKINSLKVKENDLIPIAMKNGLDISIKELGKIDSFQKNENGLAKAIEELIKENKDVENLELRQAINNIEEKSKQISNSVRKGEEKSKKEYKELIKDIEDLANSFDFKEDRREKERFKYIRDALEIQKKLSKDDLVLEYPIFMEDGFENLQIIIPDLHRGINKDSMRFLLNFNLPNLGNIKFELGVEGKNISVEFITDEKNIPEFLEKQNIFNEALNSIGYNLKDFSYYNKKGKKDYSLKAVDRRL